MQQTNQDVKSETQMETVTTEQTGQADKIKDSQKVIQYLSERFPQCFSASGEAKPLKIGIFQDIAAQLSEDDPISKTSLRAALRKYTSSWRYLASVKEGAQRVDLAGADAGLIEAEHAEHAQTQLAESKKRAAENRKKKAPARKPRNADKAKDGERKFSPRKRTAKPSAKIQYKRRSKPIEPFNGELKLGMEIRVSLGNSPVPCTLREINGDEVVVETTTGMTIKTEKKNLV
ncbi:ProP expression regulator [Catenovulum agarivorans DS-2]|uniref:RNA chaperone ProQ n=1 Tax=Catenovulum agarivorans DS-2 TaxID=1328313 RepID=W7QDJ4_9ALTE|nr:RNA chaperone ProQ [Catenovulum agarivorans]EWH09986.1 ProP expression regulator [Catenovulum agarivorans DS-2]